MSMTFRQTTVENELTRDICVGADMARELGHEGTAEPPNFSVRLSLGVKIGSTLPSTHAKTCKSILEYLLETKELEDGKVDGGMESQSALVGSQSRVVLVT